MPLGDPDARLDRCLSLFAEFQSLGVFSLLLSGGEPTLHNSFLTIAAAAAEAVPRIIINTNGLRLSRPEFADKLKIASPEAMIAISLDSPDIVANDLNRGKSGSHAIRAIQNCAERGMNVCISAVLTETTLDSAASMVNELSHLVKTFRFFPRVPRNNDDASKNGPRYEKKIAEFYLILRALAAERKDVTILTPFGNAALMGWDFGKMDNAECICAETRLYINSRFEVFPCFYSANLRNLIGSCSTTSVADLWNSKRAVDIRANAEKSRPCCMSESIQSVPARYQETA